MVKHAPTHFSVVGSFRPFNWEETEAACLYWLRWLEKRKIPAAIVSRDCNGYKVYSVFRQGEPAGEKRERFKVSEPLEVVQAVNGFKLEVKL